MKNTDFIKAVVIVFLSILTIFDICCFFYVKNATYKYKRKRTKITIELNEEKRRLNTIKIEFAKKYNYNELSKMADDKLKLKKTNVKQVKHIADVIKYYGNHENK